jgi:antitoxin PrlF
MSLSTISSKGQLVVPASVRERMGVGAGSRIEFVETPEGWLLRPVSSNIESLRGVLRKPATKVSLDDMARVVRERANASHTRGKSS